MKEIETGDAPKDFFYGYPHIRDAGFKVSIGNSRKDPGGIFGQTLLAYERLRNRTLNFGLASSRVIALADEISAHDMALSFNDFFSLSMGLYRSHIKGNTRLLGGFHGLSDLVDRVPPLLRGYAKSRIARAIDGLDHLFFSGEVDREVAIEMYGIDRDKTTYYPFGVDTEFWHPAAEARAGTGVLSIGSDPSRDFATLIQADIACPVRIITRLNVAAPGNRPNVEIVRGSLFGSEITDVMLRELYQHAQVIVVPLKNVWQPTGCSVSLQAMACGKPVVISNIKGLWDQALMKSGENCLLVPPGDPQALSEAIRTLEQDAQLRLRLGAAARETAVKHFAISRMNTALEAMIRQQADRTGRVFAV
ncbi:glycosyltransferase family 4 protein [Magnetovibrio sp.]|uniref:glycosyltransferase family 4 protein n=1 Tax=Magnetovibrio sp. TaxID=2024836 RepID=UPI002F95D0B9